MKKQRQFVEKYLLENEYISSKFAYQNYIPRLASVICVLKNNGWDIEKAKRVKTKKGVDWVYKLNDAPYKKVIYTVEGHEPIIKWERKKLSTTSLK